MALELRGGDTAQDNASIGSIYLRTDAGPNGLQLYHKFSTGSPSSASDWTVLATQALVDAAITGISWREPARVRDNTAFIDAAAAELAFNTGSPQFISDGVLLQDGDRILFTNFTTGSPATANENVYIVSITGSPFVLTLTEDTNLATDGDALLITEGSSAETQWVYDGNQWILFATATSSAELGFIRDFIGKNAAGAENPNYTSTTVVTQSNDLETAIGELDTVLGPVEDQQDTIFTANVIAQTAVDSFSIAIAEWAKWLVSVEDVGTPTRRRSSEIDVITNGTDIDFTDFARLKLGVGNITGLNITVALVGSPAQIQLLVTSSSGVDVTVKRLGFGTF